MAEHSNISKSTFFDYVFLLLKVSALFFVVYKFNLEKDTLIQKITPLIIGGFAIHYWLPRKFKLPFFLLVSFATILLILGQINGIVLISVGFVALIICHLPLIYNLRLILLGVFILLFVLIGVNVVEFTNLSLLVPFIGTMFLMRILLYAYELKFEDNTKNGWKRISYFFLLPNICFPLFPLVDFKSFTKTYYNTSNDNAIYQLAIRRIFNGTVHLIAYRFIYYYLVPDPNSINDVFSILQFLIFSYALILRLSGIFHLSLGILGLFGFNLPEIFDNYFFASSFSDVWKRINTYWREALMKVLYYPIFFKIKKRFKSFALPISILIVFIINWFLHGYQWFWVRGSFPLTSNDVLFWSIFGIAVMANSIYLERKRRPKEILKKSNWNIKKATILILKTVGMFMFMSILWMLWTSSSLTEWIYLLSYFISGTKGEYLIISLFFILLFILLLYLNYSFKSGWFGSIIKFYSSNINTITSIFISLLLVISFSETTSFIKIDGINLVSSLQKNKLNIKDKKIMERGYYQNLLNNEKTSMQLWQNKLGQTKEWPKQNEALVNTTNILRRELKPNQHVFFKGKSLTTNSHGMRDREYPIKKQKNTYRIALLGGSYEMGSGVGDNENYESVVENLLNTQQQKYEVLNFAVGGYHLIESVYNCKNKVLQFQPNSIVYVAHSDEFYRLNNKLTSIIKLNTLVTDSFLLRVFELAGITSKMCRLEIHNRLKPFIPTIIKWGYLSIVQNCKKNSIHPIWVYLPAIADEKNIVDYKKTTKIAHESGFTTISLDNVYKGFDMDSLIIAPWDAHPNKIGHSIIGNKLYKELLLNSEKLELKID